jgi:hypothetical protein
MEKEIAESKDFGHTVKLSMQVHLLKDELADVKKDELADVKKNSELAKAGDKEADVLSQEVETVADAATQNRMQFNAYRRINDRSY